MLVTASELRADGYSLGAVMAVMNNHDDVGSNIHYQTHSNGQFHGEIALRNKGNGSIQ